MGSVILNLPLPFEISAALGLVGYPFGPNFIVTWLQSLMISAVVLAVTIFFALRIASSPSVAIRAVSLRPVAGGVLDRAGVRDLMCVKAIEAEDHYCRISFADETSSLVHGRFVDALAEVESLDGAVVRRGHWLASSGVSHAVRVGRRWHIVLIDQTTVAVSNGQISDVRARGWLNWKPVAPASSWDAFEPK